jgi:hemerythrin-like domain-containing protein
MAVASRGRTRTAERQTAQDVLTLLKRDHREVSEMFDKVEELGERAGAQRGKLGEQICEALELHSKFEEQVLYPRFQERAEGHEEIQQILEAFEEHSIVDQLVTQLKRMDAKDDRYEAKLMVIIDMVRHHIKEEEREMFPLAKEIFEREELVEMGEEFVEAKSAAGKPIR